MEDMLENHDGRRVMDDGDGEGGLALRSTELLRVRPPALGMGMGFVVGDAPLMSTGLWVLIEFERCRVCETRAEVAVASEVAVVVVGGGGEPIGWRGSDVLGVFFGTEEGGVFFGALSAEGDAC